MEIENILKLVKAVSDSSLTDFEYEEGGVKIYLKAEKAMVVSEGVTAPVPVYQESVVVQPQAQTEAAAAGKLVTSPLVGTFYAAPAEDAEAFVQVGDQVKKGQTLAIVEAMKLMNEIESEVEGTISEVLVTNGQAVEYGQPLFRIG